MCCAACMYCVLFAFRDVVCMWLCRMCMYLSCLHVVMYTYTNALYAFI